MPPSSASCAPEFFAAIHPRFFSPSLLTFCTSSLAAFSRASFATCLTPCCISFCTSCRKIICTAARVASCAGTIPAVVAPKLAKAAAIIAATWIASRISEAMIRYFVYSTSSAVRSHDSASCSHACSIWRNWALSPSVSCAQNWANASADSPCHPASTSRVAASPVAAAPGMACPAAVHASRSARSLSSSPSGQLSPTTMGNNHLTSSGMSMPMRQILMPPMSSALP